MVAGGSWRAAVRTLVESQPFCVGGAGPVSVTVTSLQVKTP